MCSLQLQTWLFNTFINIQKWNPKVKKWIWNCVNWKKQFLKNCPYILNLFTYQQIFISWFEKEFVSFSYLYLMKIMRNVILNFVFIIQMWNYIYKINSNFLQWNFFNNQTENRNTFFISTRNHLLRNDKAIDIKYQFDFVI